MRLLATLLLTILFWVPAAAADDVAELAQTNRLLQAEFELAKSQKLYFIFDLQASEILYKVSGVTVARLPILSLRSWGRPADGIAYTLAKRTARKEPQREQIAIPDGREEEKPTPPPAPPKPGEPPKAPDLQALEIADMPTEYELQLDDGTLLSIRSTLPENASFQEKLRYYKDKYSWFISRSLISLSQHRQGSSYNEMRLTLPEREARMLYWSFQEGGRCLVHWP
ncbi:MAG: hypothetical protein FDZ69_04190 [Deltaproteobacteria bacterium]|nr:MAG: hypothetical protein FDZ69_04190 [Deltaproteobacteria bacterium]